MANGIYSAVSGAVAQTRILDTVANNLANVSTPGFKGERLAFSEVLSNAARAGLPEGGSFVAPSEARLDLRPGQLRPTEDGMDLALEGTGFICLQDGARQVYSRGGTLRIRPDGILSDRAGRPLLDDLNRPLRPGVEATRLTISEDGTVTADDQKVGKLKLVEFGQPALLERLGQNLMAAPPAANPAPARDVTVRQGYLEAANINAVSEVNALILASRAYETMHRVLSTYREVDTRVANELGKE